uniref:Uncharacterized protein n=1 Tax=Avena sativa TaxID=4498 RepID=A0ACD5ZNE6_AVESA
MPLLLLPTACCAAAAAAAQPSPSVAFSRSPPSQLCASHLVFAFPRLTKYGRRNREPIPTSFDEADEDVEEEEEEEEEDDDMEEAVDEDIFLKNRPKPAGFGVGKTYTTDIEERLLREMGLGAQGRKSEPATAKSLKAADSAKETGADLSKNGVHVRIWNLPKKKNIHKDLNLAFNRFPGLVTINPANSGTKKTRDPICKGFAFLKLESLEAATRTLNFTQGRIGQHGQEPFLAIFHSKPL